MEESEKRKTELSEVEEKEVWISERTMIPMGSGGIVISLPKRFIDMHNLKPGDKVLMRFNDFMEVFPPHRKKDSKEAEDR
jgi:hypothetical protein